MKKLLTIFFFLLSVTVFSQTRKATDFFVKGKIFPYISMTTIDGDIITSEMLDNTIVMYNVGFQNCAPCRTKMKGLNTLYNRYKNHKNFKIIYLSLDHVDKVKEYRKNHRAEYPFASMKDVKIEGMEKVNFSCPMTIITNKKGEIIYQQTGGATNEKKAEKDIMEKIVPIIERELQI